MLHFADKPYLLIDEQNQQTQQYIQNDIVILNCTFIAYPIPNIVQWYNHENNELPRMRILTFIDGPNIIRSELAFDGISTAEQGIYRCVASNEYGTAEFSYQLRVQVKTTTNGVTVLSRVTTTSMTGILT